MFVFGFAAWWVLVGGGGGREAGPAEVDAAFDVFVPTDGEAGDWNVGSGDS